MSGITLSLSAVSMILSIAAALFTSWICASRVISAGGDRTRARSIDGLRGYAALAVFMHHFIIWHQLRFDGRAWRPPEWHFLSSLGSGGVVLFFMTTGYLFYPKILQGFVSVDWIDLYLKRIFRIIPLIVFSVVLILMTIELRTSASFAALNWSGVLLWITSWNEPPLLGYADSGRMNAYVLWSLYYEWLFYLIVLPICALAHDMLRLASRGRFKSWLIPLALLLSSWLLIKYRPLNGIFTYLPFFAFGMLAFECRQMPIISNILTRPSLALIGLVVLGVAMNVAPNPYSTSGILMYGLVFTIIACGNDLFGLLVGRGPESLGNNSYAIYLLHGLILDIVFTDLWKLVEPLGSEAALFLLPGLCVILVVAAAAAYRVIELPAIAVGHTISVWRRTPGVW